MTLENYLYGRKHYLVIDNSENTIPANVSIYFVTVLSISFTMMLLIVPFIAVIIAWFVMKQKEKDAIDYVDDLFKADLK